METYWAILERVRGSTLRLTKLDDDILEHLAKDFPDYDPAATINEDEMKSKTGKERWRNFMMAYEKNVDDYNFGTMMRIAPNVEYGRDETIFGKYTISLSSESERECNLYRAKRDAERSDGCRRESTTVDESRRPSTSEARRKKDAREGERSEDTKKRKKTC